MAHGISLGWLGGVVHLGPNQQQLLRLGGSHGEPRKQQSKGGHQNRDTGQLGRLRVDVRLGGAPFYVG